MPRNDDSRPPYARVAVNVPQVQGLFDYSLPEDLKVEPLVGQLVTVPFGKQHVQGVIIDFPEIPAVSKTKDLKKVLDSKPVITQYQIELARMISEKTLSPLGVTLHSMIPAGLSIRADIQYQLSENSHAILENGEYPITEPSPSQTRLVDLIIERGPLRGRQLDRAFPHKNWRATAGSLERRGILTSRATLGEPSVRPKLEKQVIFSADPNTALEQMGDLARKGYPEALLRRQNILKLLMNTDSEVSAGFLYQETGGSLTDLKQLAKRGLITINEVSVLRDPLDGIKVTPQAAPILTDDQELVWEQVSVAFTQNAPDPFLLHGVTGSGKTEIYLRAVEKTLRLGSQVIILVPEIALTPQTVSRFMSRFPGDVGVLHSELSPGERYDTWRLTRAGKIKIIIGPRSALFTPFPNPGLIVVDECHDDSYYQGDLTPRYHAVRAAADYAAITGSVCILGSATPNITTTFQAKRGKWKYLSLPERILAHKETIKNQLSLAPKPSAELRYIDLTEELKMAKLPQVEVIDMRAELRQGNRSIFSIHLQESLLDTLNKRQQAILFLNRRGSASYIFCRDCGYAIRCPRCETSLTLHQKEQSLRCHHCGYKRNIPKICPACRSDRIRHLGTGTEQVESTLTKLLPGVRTLRWDRDTTRTKGAHWEIMKKFTDHEADVLIGTQMLAKGLDLPLVTLVGVVLADTGLHLPDYRATERTFQVLTQVAGRAGRSPLGGNVILQTFDPDHYVLRAASEHDYDSFYQQEIKYRQELTYPPFVNLIRLEIRDRDPNIAESKAQAYGEALSSWIKNKGMSATQVVGPVPAYFQKLRGEYRWQILVKGPNPARIIKEHPPGQEWIIEVDPPVIL
jgi:primosomal protein N' (replication factor Y)